MVEKTDFSQASYVVGILSIVLAATFNPIPGIVLGIVGLFLGKRQKTLLSKRGIKFSMIGIIVSILVFVAVVLLNNFTSYGSVGNFPVG